MGSAGRHSKPSRRKQAAPTRRKAARSRTASRTSPRRRTGRRLRLAVVGTVVAAILAGAVALASAYCQFDAARVELCEQWRDTVRQACIDCKVDTKWTDAILAMMAVESGGDTDVESVVGVKGDIMQAAEGAYGDIVRGGSSKYAVQAQTPEASIYAGVLEFKQNLKLWKDYLDGIGVDEVGKVQLVVQGYNFGADGWYSWCAAAGIKSYTVEAAQEYSDTEMPESAKGTPAHAKKWLGYYEMIRA